MPRNVENACVLIGCRSARGPEWGEGRGGRAQGRLWVRDRRSEGQQWEALGVRFSGTLGLPIDDADEYLDISHSSDYCVDVYGTQLYRWLSLHRLGKFPHERGRNVHEDLLEWQSSTG
jgi:hypothetical protein